MPPFAGSAETGADVRRDLESPIRTVRLFAYDEILRTRAARHFRDALKQRESLEDDEECRIMLQHALAMADEATSVAPSPGETQKSESARSSFLIRSVEEWQKLARDFPDSIAAETNPLALAEMIRQIGRYLEPAQRQSLEPYLAHRLSLVRSAALSVLIERFPEELAPRLPNVLKSRDPRLRALAVRGLARIDPDEAVRHLELMLLGSDPALRRFGLQIVSLLPFSLVRDLMVRFALLVEEPPLVRAASAVFRSNPDPDVGFRLLEAEYQAPETQKPVIRRMLQQAEEALSTSGVLGAEAPRHAQRMEEWRGRLAARVTLQELLALVPEESADASRHLADQLGTRVAEPLMRRTLEESLSWNLPPHLEAAVKGVLTPRTENVPPPASASAADEVPPEVDLERQLAKLRISEKNEAGLDLLSQALTNAAASTDTRILALRAAAAWSVHGYEEQAGKWLFHADHRLVAGALEYLTAVDPERVHPQLGRFLASPHPLVKLRAILLLKRYDLPQAISALLALIRLPDTRTHRLLSTSLVQFEFSLLRGPLTDFLCQTGGAVFLRESLCLFLANPARENLVCLYRIESAAHRTSAVQVRNTREACEKMLLELGLMSAEEVAIVRQQCEEDLARRKARALSPPVYAVERVFHEGPTIREHLARLRQSLAQIDAVTVKKACFVVFIFAPLVYFWWTYVLYTPVPFSLDPGANTALQRLARSPTSARTAAPAPAKPMKSAVTPQDDFSRVVEREVSRELSSPLPPGLSQETAWLFQASEHPMIGLALEKAELGNTDQAISDLERLLAQAPDNPYLQMRVLSILCRLYQLKGDETLLKKAQERFVAAMDRLSALFPVSFRDFLRAQEQMLEHLKQPDWGTSTRALGSVSPADLKAGMSQLEGLLPLNSSMYKRNVSK